MFPPESEQGFHTNPINRGASQETGMAINEKET